jgi:hypothetical protein
MYPAQAFVDGIYTVHDLPDALDYSGTNAPVTLNKLNTPEQSNYFDGIAYFRGEYEFSGEQEIVDLGIQDGVWALGDSLNDQARTTPLCLIDDFRTEDQFADTYTVTINPPDDNAGTYTVTRRSICVWSTQVEESGEPAGLKLSYIDAVIGGGFAYTWQIELDTSYIKDGFANTPTGDYAGGNAAVS